MLAVNCTRAPSCAWADRLVPCLCVLQDPSEYFQHSNGFIVYSPSLPKRLLEAAATYDRNFTLEATQPHFALVNYQLLQVH